MGGDMNRSPGDGESRLGIPSMKYLFYVHKDIPARLLVCRNDLGIPSQTTAQQWRLARARDAANTNPHVRHEVDVWGYSPFRLGGRFSDIEAGRAGLTTGSRR
jgi:hypothetical protein